MKSGRSTGNPTKAQLARFVAIKDIGCIVAMMRGLGHVPCEIHHLTLGGKHGQKRRGHDFTVGLNPWSHRGVPFGDLSAQQCEAMFGPSYAREPVRFRNQVGNDETLLAEQDRLIQIWKESIVGIWT